LTLGKLPITYNRARTKRNAVQSSFIPLVSGSAFSRAPCRQHTRLSPLNSPPSSFRFSPDIPIRFEPVSLELAHAPTVPQRGASAEPPPSKRLLPAARLKVMRCCTGRSDRDTACRPRNCANRKFHAGEAIAEFSVRPSAKAKAEGDAAGAGRGIEGWVKKIEPLLRRYWPTITQAERAPREALAPPTTSGGRKWPVRHQNRRRRGASRLARTSPRCGCCQGRRASA